MSEITPSHSSADQRSRPHLPHQIDRSERLAAASSQVLLTPEDVVPDAALGRDDRDEFDHAAIAGRVAELAMSAKPPVNIALFSPFGSGKSSFFELLTRELEQRDAKIIPLRYDAWKYGGASLKRNFITSAAHELGLSDPEFGRGLYESRKVVRIEWKRFFREHWQGLYWMLLVALALSVTWTAVLATWDAWSGSETWLSAFQARAPGTISILGTILVGVLVIMKILDLAKITVDQSAPSADEEFAARFRALVSKATRRSGWRLLVFVDELDRCAPEDVVATLISLKTFLDEDRCVFVVAADRDVLQEALDKDLPQSTPIRDQEPYYSTAGAFLDKVFQHQIALPPLRQHTLTRFARSLFVLFPLPAVLSLLLVIPALDEWWSWTAWVFDVLLVASLIFLIWLFRRPAVT